MMLAWGLLALPLRNLGASVSRTEFPQLYNCPTSQENCEFRQLRPPFILPIGSQGRWAEESRKEQRGNGEGTGVFLICEMRQTTCKSEVETQRCCED